jgi:hypothetical protein
MSFFKTLDKNSSSKFLNRDNSLEHDVDIARNRYISRDYFVLLIQVRDRDFESIDYALCHQWLRTTGGVPIEMNIP